MRTDGEADGGGGGGGGGTHIHPLSLSIFFQGPRAFEPLPSSYTWKRQCRRRMAGRAFARSKFNRLVPLAHLPPSSPVAGWRSWAPDRASFDCKGGPPLPPSTLTLLFSAALPLPCGDKEEGGGGHSPPSSLGQRPKLSSLEEGGRRRRAIKWAARPHHVQLIAAGGRWRPGTRRRRPKRGRKGPGLT